MLLSVTYFIVPYLLHFAFVLSLLFYFFLDLLSTKQMTTLIAIQGGTSLMLTFIMGVFYKNHLIRMIYMGAFLNGKNLALRPAARALAKPFADQYRFEKRLLGRVLKRVERKLHV